MKFWQPRKTCADDSGNSDGELIRDYLAGDLTAFEQLYRRYRLPLYGFLNRRFAGRESMVDDIFQQSWIKVVAMLGHYRDDGKFSAWLMRIARNQGIDMLRRSLRREETELPVPEEGVEAMAPECADNGFRELCAKENERRLQTALSRLGDAQREVATLRLEGWSFREIAILQQCPLSTALARMEYALKKLRTELCHDQKPLS